MTNNQQSESLMIRLSSALLQRLHKHKEDTGIPVSEFVRRAIEKAFNQ